MTKSGGQMARNNTFNAAQRLLELVQRMKKTNPSLATWNVYILAFGENEDNQQETALMYAYELAKLAGRVEDTIKHDERIEDTLLPQLGTVFTQCRETNLSVQWNKYLNRLSDVGVTALQAYSIFFSDIITETKISDDEYQKLADEVQDLISEVLNLDNEELKTVLMAILESARRAIFLYKFNGSQPFEEVFSYSFGKLSVKFKKGEFTKKETDGIVSKVFGFTIKLGELASAVNAMTALPSEMKDFLKQIGQ
ncbi:hypothetical protein [Pseudodesulfovibrio karagichevae]|uniref:Uncharacterized protein n=1 Tax=Pseudodesulfovibrio karagichevae TaxID=3239305 RepID=A0ABV4K5Q6_9BACT